MASSEEREQQKKTWEVLEKENPISKIPQGLVIDLSKVSTLALIASSNEFNQFTLFRIFVFCMLGILNSEKHAEVHPEHSYEVEPDDCPDDHTSVM